MKFCYCPECKDLQPTAWYRRKVCKRCGGECRIISVPIYYYGMAMYALSAVGAILVGAEIIRYDLGLGDLRLYLMFGSLILAMIFAGLESARALEIAEKQVGRVL